MFAVFCQVWDTCEENGKMGSQKTKEEDSRKRRRGRKVLTGSGCSIGLRARLFDCVIRLWSGIVHQRTALNVLSSVTLVALLAYWSVLERNLAVDHVHDLTYLYVHTGVHAVNSFPGYETLSSEQ